MPWQLTRHIFNPNHLGLDSFSLSYCSHERTFMSLYINRYSMCFFSYNIFCANECAFPAHTYLDSLSSLGPDSQMLFLGDFRLYPQMVFRCAIWQIYRIGTPPPKKKKKELSTRSSSYRKKPFSPSLCLCVCVCCNMMCLFNGKLMKWNLDKKKQLYNKLKWGFWIMQ